MPTDLQSLSKILEEERSLLGLPRELRSSALSILSEIQRCDLKHALLRATELRIKARMDAHRFCRLFSWLQQQGYCRVRKSIVTRLAKKGKAYRLAVKLISISERGEAVLRRVHKLGRLTGIARSLHIARSPRQEMDAVIDLVVEASGLVYSELYYEGKLREFERFRDGLEEGLRECLNKEIGDGIGLVYDAYLFIRRIPGQPLLEDAKLAREKGHFLTANHRYVLRKMEGMKKEDLQAHNILWRDRVMKMKFIGNISFQDFQDLVDPYRIVEREWNERSTPGLPGHTTISLTRDSYNANMKWQLDFNELQKRWKRARAVRFQSGRGKTSHSTR